MLNVVDDGDLQAVSERHAQCRAGRAAIHRNKLLGMARQRLVRDDQREARDSAFERRRAAAAGAQPEAEAQAEHQREARDRGQLGARAGPPGAVLCVRGAVLGARKLVVRLVAAHELPARRERRLVRQIPLQRLRVLLLIHLPQRRHELP
jgi:hypothetical protein